MTCRRVGGVKFPAIRRTVVPLTMVYRGRQDELHEFLRQWPCLAELDFDDLEISAYDSAFRKQSLLENASIDDRETKELYVIQNGRLHPVTVNRVAKAIYPPDSLHPGIDYSTDEDGWSETVEDALKSVRLAGVRCVVLHHRRSSWFIGVNKITVAKLYGDDHIDAVRDEDKARCHSVLFCEDTSIGSERKWDYVQHLRSTGWFVVKPWSFEWARTLVNARCNFDVVILHFRRPRTTNAEMNYLIADMRNFEPDASIAVLADYKNKQSQMRFRKKGAILSLNSATTTPTQLQEGIETLIRDKTSRTKASPEGTAEVAEVRQEPTIIDSDLTVVTAPPVEMDHSPPPQTRSLASERRAKTVAQLIGELGILKPQIFGLSDYESLAKEHPEFLVFHICENHKDLRQRAIYDDEFSRRHIRLAQDLAARFHGVSLSTIQTDWKKDKPAEFRYKPRGKQ
jgi:hypothetical protein